MREGCGGRRRAKRAAGTAPSVSEGIAEARAKPVAARPEPVKCSLLRERKPEAISSEMRNIHLRLLRYARNDGNTQTGEGHAQINNKKVTINKIKKDENVTFHK
jgi:hypothetical protein